MSYDDVAAPKGVDFSTWAAEKEKTQDKQRRRRDKERAKQRECRKIEKDLADLHFKQWLLRKTNFEKAQQLLHNGIDKARAGPEKDWKEVGVALAAVDQMLGAYDLSSAAETLASSLTSGYSRPLKAGKENAKGKTTGIKKRVKSLRDDFFKWSKGRAGDARHTFQDVPVPDKDALKFSNQMQETMEEYARSYNHNERIPKDEQSTYILSSLAYTPPLGRKPKNGFEELMITQGKILNKMWMKRLIAGWKECQKEVLRKKGEAMGSALEAANEDPENESKNARESIDADTNGDGIVTTDERVTKKVLYSLGLAQLIKMKNRDELREKKEKKKHTQAKRDEGLKAHQAWSNKKGNCLIKMPPPEVNPYTGKPVARNAPPRMDFSGRGVARSKARTVMQNSVDIMMGSGMKYIHASGYAKQPGQKGDLERSRESLIKSGYVAKHNFIDVIGIDHTEGDVDKKKLDAAKYDNPAMKRKAELNKVKEERNTSDRYESWARQKARSANAVKYLNLIETPYEGESKTQGEAARERRWQRIGKMVKGVDINLLPQWANWSQSFKRFGECQAEWKGMEPVVPSGGNSGFAVIAQDTLLRIFSHRRDYDWHEAFDVFATAKHTKWSKAYNDRLTDKEPPSKQELLAKLALNPKNLQTFFRDNGIELTDAETESLFVVFDKNGDKRMDRQEFMEFARAAQTATLNPSSEFWVKLFAKKKGRGKSARRSDSSDGGGGYEDEGFDDDDDEQKKTIADWNDKRRDECLAQLRHMARHNLEALERSQIIEQGVPPFPPRLRMERVESDTPGQQTTTLRLRWAPGSKADRRGGGVDPPGTKIKEPAPVVFFMLETGGKMTGRAIKKFVHLCKDPPASGQTKQGGFIHIDLEPNTRYQYRLTAYNGFGPSEPTYSAFTTLPMAPPPPRLISTAVTVNTASVTLDWGEGGAFKVKMRELRRAFAEADENGDGTLTRAEFSHAVTKQPSLREFLSWSMGMDHAGAMGDSMLEGSSMTAERERETVLAFFDDMDTDQDDRLTFTEFSKFFLSRARTNTQKSMRASDGESGEGRFEGDVEVKTSDAGAAVSTGTKFCLNRCVADETPPVFSSVMGAPTHKTRWTVEDLVPGQSYQFTVQAFNLDGEPGPASRATIVSTMMQQPNKPKVLGKPTLDSVTLKWKAAPQLDLAAMMMSDTKATGQGASALRRSAPATGAASSLRASLEADSKNPLRASAQISATSSKGEWFKQINEWATGTSASVQGGDGSGLDYGESGVGSETVARVFARYDTDDSKQLDTTELRAFLKDMGVPFDDDAVDACLLELDSNDDRRVSLAEFTAYWKQHVVSYIVKRDAGTSDAALAALGGRLPRSSAGSSNFQIVHIGSEPSCVIGDLAPNTMYRFIVQYRSRRATSPASAELQIMTPPGPPTQPVAVHTGAREVTIKWYAGAGGAAFKYIVYFQHVASRLGDSKAGASSSSSLRDWNKCYEGSETVCRITDKLEPDSMYNVKVVAVNRQYESGEPSLPTQVCTVRRQDEVACTRATVDDVFKIDCTGDVVTGDTILFTERVYAIVSATDKAKLAKKSRGRGGHGRSSRQGGLASSSGSITLSQSIDGGGLNGTKSQKEFVCERTVAAVVFRERLGGGNGGSDDRTLSLQVIWCTVSRTTPAAKKSMLRPGAVVQRSENDLFEFEVLRAAWEHEDSRWSSAEERSTRAMDSSAY